MSAQIQKSAKLNFCGNMTKTISKDLRKEVSYSKVFSVSKYVEFVRNAVGCEIFDENVNMLLQAESEQNPRKFEKYGSLKWSWEKEMEIENESEQEKWKELKLNIFEGDDFFNQKKEQEKKREFGSILHYSIPISFPSASFKQGNSDQIYVKAFGLSIYGPSYVINFEAPEAYLRLKSLNKSKFARFGKFLGLKTFNMQDYEREFRKDFDFMDAFSISGPFIRIHSIIENKSEGTETEIDYFGDYTFNIHLSKVVNEVKIETRTGEDKNGKAIVVKQKIPVMKGRTEGCYSIPITKYKLVFNWMTEIKNYEKVSFPIKLVMDDPTKEDETDLMNEEDDENEHEVCSLKLKKK